MATGFSAVKSGVVMFVIPFIFALYPEILLIEAAVIDPVASANGSVSYLAGYDGERHWFALTFVLLRVSLALYLLASALAGFDQHRLKMWEIVGRLSVVVLVLSLVPMLQLLGVICALGIVIYHSWSRARLA